MVSTINTPTPAASSPDPAIFWPADPGCITSTPKSADFSKKHEKWAKYERDSCIPQPKNGERPYLATSETPFLGVIFGLFLEDFRIPVSRRGGCGVLVCIAANAHQQHHTSAYILFLFVCLKGGAVCVGLWCLGITDTHHNKPPRSNSFILYLHYPFIFLIPISNYSFCHLIFFVFVYYDVSGD